MATRGKNALDLEEKNLDKIIQHIDKKIDTMKKEILTKMELFKEETQKSMEFISNQYDEIIKKMDLTLLQNKKIEGEIETIKKEQQSKNTIIKHLEIKLSELDSKFRSKYLEIAGIKQTGGENTTEIVKRVAAAAGLEIKSSEITEVKRIPDRRTDAPPKLLVHFNNKTSRDNLIAAKRNINYADIKGLTEDKIYIGEELTPYHKELLWHTKQFAKEKNYTYVWYKEGRIMMRRTTNDKIFYIKHVDDLKKIT